MSHPPRQCLRVGAGPLKVASLPPISHLTESTFPQQKIKGAPSLCTVTSRSHQFSTCMTPACAACMRCHGLQ